MKHRWPYLVAILVLMAVGARIYSRTPDEIVHPRRGDITEAVYGLGKVKSNHRFEAIVGVISTVTHLYVHEGDFVPKGTPLIEFNSEAVFRAPFAGTVTFVKVYEQETIVPHTPALRLEDLNDRYVELSLEQQAAIRVKKGMPAKVSFESNRGKILAGTVSTLFPREDEFLAQVKVDNLESNVLPGMTADVTIEVGKLQDVLLVPLRAIQNGMVTVRREGHWRKVKVEVGHVDGLYAEVKGDTLAPTDELRIRAKEN